MLLNRRWVEDVSVPHLGEQLILKWMTSRLLCLIFSLA